MGADAKYCDLVVRDDAIFVFARGSVTGEILGEPSLELKAKLAGSKNPQLFTPFMSYEGKS